MALNTLEVLILTLPMLAMGFFFIRKLYYHLEFAKIHDSTLRDESLLDVCLNPILFIQVFYIFIPVFIKSERMKVGKELDLERKIVRALSAFWLCFLLVFLIATIEYIYVHDL